MTALQHENLTEALGRGHPHVLGAHVEQGGVNFAVLAPHADAVELCLFDHSGTTETQRLRLKQRSSQGIWHGFLQGAQPGLLFGWRVHGPWQPEHGHRFNANKLLLDPCAKEVWGSYDGGNGHLGYSADVPDQPDTVDNSASALKGRVLADLPQANTLSPQILASKRIIYELHVKGFSKLNFNIPEALRGTYSGLAHPVCIDHFKALGVTTLCLMPVAHRVDEKRLLDAGLSNYWGYNPIAWNAPERRYAAECSFSDSTVYGATRLEFRAMVEQLHAAGMEVVLDVVYNHSGETDEWGPTLSMRGLDNATYYHLDPKDRRKYANWTGCGNCLNLSHPLVLRMAMDSLRQWVLEFGIDGFRFDLAPVMARRSAADGGAFDAFSPLFAAIDQDPVLRKCTMIAEPWDIGEGGYRLGQFPTTWLEWNDRFRDVNRGFWLSAPVSRGEFANRLAGSTDYFDPKHRAPCCSVNFITAHDGFTLTDLVSFTHRHNWANLEGNRDGHGHNLSMNFGTEGHSNDVIVSEVRSRAKRVLLASLLLSLGTPMLLAGDEFGNSQYGNNNAYCQDNATTWLDWEAMDLSLFQFTAKLISLRQALPGLTSNFWGVTETCGVQVAAEWFSPEGTSLFPDDWARTDEKAFALLLKSSGVYIVLFNAKNSEVCFSLPAGEWTSRLNTFELDVDGGTINGSVQMQPMTLGLFELNQPSLTT